MKASNKITQSSDLFDLSEVEFHDVFQRAKKITWNRFKNKRSFFNPLYISNVCFADCPYCGFRVSNNYITRRTLNLAEVQQETDALTKRKVSNIKVLAGDYKHSKYVKMVSRNIQAIRENTKVKWVGIEVASLDESEYEILLESGVQSVTVFQETYDESIYYQLHKSGAHKGDFEYRLNSQERAIRAGINQVGFGVLLGIGDWRNDVLAMWDHANRISNLFPNSKLEFSFPRLKPSIGQSKSCQREFVTDFELLNIILMTRLQFPSSNLVITGRESLELIQKLLPIVNIIGYAGTTEVGGYSLEKKGSSQFDLKFESSLEEFRAILDSLKYEIH